MGGQWVYGIFVAIAFQIKNLFIAIAIIFLIIGILKLLFSSASDEDVKKWRSNIIWVSVGIFLMQIAFSVWNTLIIKNTYESVGSVLGYSFWINVFSPIVGLIQMLASFGFIIMMIYAFYIMVTGSTEEEKVKKWRNTVIYAVIWFLLIKIPEAFVRTIYGSPDCKEKGWLTLWDCEIKEQRLSWAVEIIGKIFNFFNTFLSIICVILIVYAGWLVLISWWDEEKLKKAKSILLYIFIGFIVLVGAHALFRFFILQG